MMDTEYQNRVRVVGPKLSNEMIMDLSLRPFGRSQDHIIKLQSTSMMKKSAAGDAEQDLFLPRYHEEEHLTKLRSVDREAVTYSDFKPEKNELASQPWILSQAEPEYHECLSYSWGEHRDMAQLTHIFIRQSERRGHHCKEIVIEGSRLASMTVTELGPSDGTAWLLRLPQTGSLHSLLLRHNRNVFGRDLHKERLEIFDMDLASMLDYATSIPSKAFTVLMQVLQTETAISERVNTMVEYTKSILAPCGLFTVSGASNLVENDIWRVPSVREVVSSYQQWFHQVDSGNARQPVGSKSQITMGKCGYHSQCPGFDGVLTGGRLDCNSKGDINYSEADVAKKRGTHDSGDHSPTSSTSSTGTNNMNGKGKRKSKDDYGGDNEDEGEGNGDHKHKRTRSDTISSSLRDTDSHTMLLACPYYKKNRLQHEACIALQLKRIKDVKQHIRRNHSQPLYCHRCGIQFGSLSEQNNHFSEIVPCMEKEFTKPEGVTEDQKLQFSQRVSRKSSLAEQWYTVWDIVFPGEPRPDSPFMESAAVEMCGEVTRFWEDHGRQLIEGYVSRLPDGLPSSDRDLSALLVNVGRKVLERITEKMSGYRGNVHEGNNTCDDGESNKQSLECVPAPAKDSGKEVKTVEDKENNITSKDTELRRGRGEGNANDQEESITTTEARPSLISDPIDEPKPATLTAPANVHVLDSTQDFNQLRPRFRYGV